MGNRFVRSQNSPNLDGIPTINPYGWFTIALLTLVLVMVVGGGSAAVEEALFLSKHASKVILILLYVEFVASPD